MKVKILKTTVADKQFVRAGTVVDLTDSEARALVQLGKAEFVSADVVAETPVSTPEQLTSETAEEVISQKLKKPRKAK